MDGNYYAAMNLRTIRENIYAYATYAENWPSGDLYDKVEAAEAAIDELIKEIENESAGN